MFFNSNTHAKKTPQNRVFSVQLHCAVESIAMLGIGLACMPYIAVDTPWYLEPISASSLIFIGNYLLRLPPYDGDITECQPNLRSIRSLLYTLYDVVYRSVLIHECGHYLAAMLLYIDAKPEITINVLAGGSTSYILANGLSPLGKALGERLAETVLYASGTALELLWCQLALVAAYTLANNQPEIKSHLLLSSVFSITGHFWYALSALWNCENPGQDYCSLQQLHTIDPISAALFILGSTLALLYCLETRTQRLNQQEPVYDEENPHIPDVARINPA